MPIFIGRAEELKQLALFYNRRQASLAVIKGRRRIGKTRLVIESASKKESRLWSFSGLVPEQGMTSQNQRNNFAQQLCTMLRKPQMTFHDWYDAFEMLSEHLGPNDIILFDEISWMAHGDITFIPKLKAWWDKQFSSIKLVLCGSVSTWIEDNVLNSTAFFGRINLTIALDPLSIPESNQLLKSLGYKGSAYDTYRLLSVCGGVPWYLHQIAPGMCANTIIKELCFKPNGVLVLEFQRIFHDLFNGKGQMYKKILHTLKEGAKTQVEVRKAIDFPHSGRLSDMMKHLQIAGFIQKQTLWSFKTTHPKKKSLFYISDPYIRFYLKMIEPNLNKINLGGYKNVTISQIPGIDTQIGIQTELLLLQNRPLLLQAANITISDIILDGPYRQFKTREHKGCQIDYLVQTQTKNLFIYEFKFKRNEICANEISKMEARLSALHAPKSFSKIPILCHIGGVSPNLETKEYYYSIIDISDLLEYDKTIMPVI